MTQSHAGATNAAAPEELLLPRRSLGKGERPRGDSSAIQVRRAISRRNERVSIPSLSDVRVHPQCSRGRRKATDDTRLRGQAFKTFFLVAGYPSYLSNSVSTVTGRAAVELVATPMDSDCFVGIVHFHPFAFVHIPFLQINPII